MGDIAFKFRQTRPVDAAALAELKRKIWSDEPDDPAQITRAILDPRHQGVLALAGKKVAGFIDSFWTLAPPGGRRWEVDLLAVHPKYRGHGLAVKLIQASLRAGRAAGAGEARGLVRCDNIYGKHVFARCGFRQSETTLRLFVCSSPGFNDMPGPEILPPSHIPVITYNYCGVWLEEDFSAAGFGLARAVLLDGCTQLAGALIPADDEEALKAAEQAGYDSVDDYNWWNRILNETDYL